MSIHCSECWNEYSQSELVNIENKWICGQCKETYLQRLQEGVQSPERSEYAGFWIRVVAKFLDGLIFGAPIWIIIYVILRIKGVSIITPEGSKMVNMISIPLDIVYYGLMVFLLSRFGATPGKMILGLKVIRPNSERLTYLRAFCRLLSEALSGFILCIGYIMVAFREDKAGLHDIICDTRVIRHQREI